MSDLGLTLILWQGVFEDKEDTWLRWCDAEGRLIPTGEERAVNAEERALQAEAEVERLRSELARRTRKKPAGKQSK